MTIHVGVHTIVNVDRENGRVSVYNADTGEVMYDLPITFREPPKEKEKKCDDRS